MSDDSYDIDNHYGNKISTVDSSGKRKWIYAFKPQGKWYNLRTYITWIYLLLLFGMPFIKVNGNPLFLFDITQGKFILFGQLFLPQDFILLGVAMLCALVIIIVFTLVFGRVFCGWICPQTIFLEMIFRKIEFWIEGPAHKQKMADKNPNKSSNYYFKKIIKHIIFLLLSFIIANTFLAYIIGIDELYKIITESVSAHIVGLLAIIGFTLVFYGVFAYVRELVCTVVCPYGRLQSVLLDKNSIAVAYDFNRGEPRNKKRNKNEVNGDCIDCGMCVNVCPTGIDIRDGLQMECVNCTACIDACNKMMNSIGKPENLITFASENDLNKGKLSKRKLNYKSKIYIGVLIALTALFFTMLFNRSVFDATVMRVPGQLYQETADGFITNLYRIKIVNKSAQTKHYTLKIEEPQAQIVYIGNALDSLKTGMHSEETFFIKVKSNELKERRNHFHLQIISEDKIIQTKKVSFIGKY